jgi:hypothetical protein
MIFKTFFAKKMVKNWRFLLKLQLVFAKKIFEKNAIFCRKLAKIAQNFDPNIDPRLAEKLPDLTQAIAEEQCLRSLRHRSAQCSEASSNSSDGNLKTKERCNGNNRQEVTSGQTKQLVLRQDLLVRELGSILVFLEISAVISR